jgi:hypothetical protein
MPTPVLVPSLFHLTLGSVIPRKSSQIINTKLFKWGTTLNKSQSWNGPCDFGRGCFGYPNSKASYQKNFFQRTQRERRITRRFGSSFTRFFSSSGDGAASYTADITSYGGISGYHGDTLFPFMGVFLGPGTPQAPAPATLQFTAGGLGFDFLTLSPELGQLFFIGDGKANGSVDQTFIVPAGGTRLFLGYPDAPGSTGAPGGFDDNRGSLEVQVTAIPEPAVCAMLFVGSLFLYARRTLPGLAAKK